MSFYQPNNIYQDKSVSDTNIEENIYYTINEHQEDLDQYNSPIRLQDDEHVYAKRTIKADGSHKYSIRLATDGKLYNPISIYGYEKQNNFLDRVCRSNDKFKQVNSKTFDWYIKFLSTKNQAWLANAERERE